MDQELPMPHITQTRPLVIVVEEDDSDPDIIVVPNRLCDGCCEMLSDAVRLVDDLDYIRFDLRSRLNRKRFYVSQSALLQSASDGCYLCSLTLGLNVQDIVSALKKVRVQVYAFEMTSVHPFEMSSGVDDRDSSTRKSWQAVLPHSGRQWLRRPEAPA